ncbi:MAG: hypothetical protein RIE06_08315 [Roseibium album]|uniref:hypothetical protein n=1 Tax=Roseibium album TaxID=311410 RepID=UPI0018C9393C|nr:hypothetical protein [Roseibium album]MBG6154043.1 hypothetical protein [Labrenzia sp. EL_162]MBG6193828.1 hypothetical protein [Labrenzia sp. EL_159]MCR9056233.1 hypothetical protein [Paracoccaceae bacterium]
MHFDFGLRGVLLAAMVLALPGLAFAAKGDLKVQVPRSAPLLKGRTLDLRFADFAQGIWVRDLEDCPAKRIDRSAPGSALAIYRGLWEMPDRICQVYGAELGRRDTQRAAINCLLNNGAESIELVTVQPRGTNGLIVQEGERPPVHFRFCEQITPVLKAAENN